MEKGMEKGKKEGKLETARGLIKNGIDFDVIARATGLSREEIEKLAAST
jgi:predicted transposase/invertase (TIGR01784 family)